MLFKPAGFCLQHNPCVHRQYQHFFFQFDYALAMSPPGEGLLRTAADFTPVLGSSLMINDGINQGNWWLNGGGVVFLTLDIAALGTISTLI